jgi:hypothetical protein
VRSQLQVGDIKDVIDESFGSNYKLNSIWRVSETAMRCVKFNSEGRPTMRIVLQELHEAMELERSQSPNRNHPTPSEVELSTTSSVLLPGPSAR